MSKIHIKICGVTTPEDAVSAAESGADAVGLNFYAKSPRFLDESRAVAILRVLPPFVAPVGLFVDTPDAVAKVEASRFGLRAVQTYPRNADEADFFPLAHIPAFRVKNVGSLELVRQVVAAQRPAAVILDSYVEHQMGGTGHRAPWDVLVGFDPGVPVILAGGLTPDNVAEAILTVKPWGVDVASGVESVPGKKDAGKVRAFVQAAQGAAAAIRPRPPESD